VKADLDNPGECQLLSQAELALLLNCSTSTVGRYIQEHFEQTSELSPIKGYVLDPGRHPTHKGRILRLYEQGMAPPDIARATYHSLEAANRYISDCERVKVLLSKELTVKEIGHAIGRGEQTVLEYHTIVLELHSHLASAE
jgi:hypothetical protein